MSLFSVRNRRNRNSHKRLLIVTACMTMLCLSACSQKSEEASTTEPSSVKVESTADFSVEKDIRVVELEDDDSGVSNPQRSFKEQFSSDDLQVLPDNYPLGGRKSMDDIEKEYYGDNYELYLEYLSTNEVTEDLYNRMKEAGLTNFDKDEDGLTDYEEMEVYHSNPNLKSTSNDVYSDKYKIEHDMDVNKFYEADWIEIDDNLSVLSEVVLNGLQYPGFTENYHDINGLLLFDIGMYFSGDVKLNVSIDNVELGDLVVEVYNVWDKTHAIINSSIIDEKISFHVNQGYDKYLIHDKDMEVVIE